MYFIPLVRGFLYNFYNDNNYYSSKSLYFKLIFDPIVLWSH